MAGIWRENKEPNKPKPNITPAPQYPDKPKDEESN